MLPFQRFDLRLLPVLAGLILAAAGPAAAVCPEASLANFGGPGTTACPCFVVGEEAGVQFTLPVDKFPIEIIRVGITWGSQFGGAPTSLEQAIHVYDAGLPDPGVPVASLLGPQLTDGFINEFDLEAQLAPVPITGSPFAVTLEFANTNAGNIFAPSVVHDGTGAGNSCQPGKNLVFATPGGWADACLLGVTGDWVMFAVYREVNCGTGISEEHLLASTPAALFTPQPNPFRGSTTVSFFVERERHVSLSVVDVQGRRVASLNDRVVSPGNHSMQWNGRLADGTPAAAGVYFVAMTSEDFRQTRKVTLTR